MQDDDQIMNQDLWNSLKDVLAGYPHLGARLPDGYPHGKRFNITLEQMRNYAARMKKRWWHQVNLPIVLHNALPSIEPDARHLMESVLRTLDRFARDFEALPGVTETLRPLWNEAWDDSPRFWSVVACAYLALRYADAGYQMEGFGLKIGDGEQDSDIAMRISGIRAHVDIEMWHAADFGQRTPEEARQELIRLADDKIGRKFPHLPTDEFGVAALVCVAMGANYDRFTKHPGLSGLLSVEGRDRQFGFPYYLAGIRPDGGSLEIALMGKPLPSPK